MNKDLSHWTNAFPGILVKRNIWAETSCATICGNSPSEFLSELHRSVKALATAMSNLSLDSLLYNNNVSILFKVEVAKWWTIGIREGAPPCHIDKWLKYNPTRPAEMEFFADFPAKEGILLAPEGNFTAKPPLHLQNVCKYTNF